MTLAQNYTWKIFANAPETCKNHFKNDGNGWHGKQKMHTNENELNKIAQKKVA